MEKLLIIFIVNLIIIGCGTEQKKKDNPFVKTQSIKRQNQIDFFTFNRVTTREREIIFSNSRTNLRNDYFVKLRANAFKGLSENKTLSTEISFLGDNKAKTINLEINSSYKLCSLKLMIQYDHNNYTEDLTEYDIQKNSFYLDLLAAENYRIQVLDFRYCNFPQSYLERVAELSKDHYFIHFEEDEIQKIIPIKSTSTLHEGLKELDSNVEIKHKRINKIFNISNAHRQYPINNNSNNDSFWFLLGINHDSVTTQIKGGSFLSLINFTMQELRDRLTKKRIESFDKHLFELNTDGKTKIKDLSFQIRVAQYQVKSTKYKSICHGQGLPKKCKYREYTLTHKFGKQKSLTFKEVNKNNGFEIVEISPNQFQLKANEVKFKLGTRCVKYCSRVRSFYNKRTKRYENFKFENQLISPKLKFDVEYLEETIVL